MFKDKWTQKENKMLQKYYFESDKNVRGYIERIHQLWIEREDRDMTKQRQEHKCKKMKRKNCYLRLR